MTRLTDGKPQAQMALSVSDLNKHYDSGFTLDSVTFDLPKGYIMGLIGPNGAGKSTLIKIILNMISRDSGCVKVFGLDNLADEVTVKEQLGIVFDTVYFPEMWTTATVSEAMRHQYPTWDQHKFEAYLKRFGLGPEKKIRHFSKGMQVKLMLAVALCHDAKLLILDEPTSGLDVLARDELMDILTDYIADGEHTVLFSTHITSDLERTADFITYICNGEVFYTGSTDEFKESFKVIRGGLDDLERITKIANAADCLLGVHRYPIGFDALVRTEQLDILLKLFGGDVLRVDPAPIDDIIRLTNMQDKGVLVR